MFHAMYDGYMHLCVAGGFTSDKPDSKERAFNYDAYACDINDNEGYATCTSVADIPAGKNRGAVVTQSGERIIFLNIPTMPSQSIVKLFDYKIDGVNSSSHAQALDVVNEIVRPSIDGVSHLTQPMGGFAALYLRDRNDLFVFGNFFNTIEGNSHTSWRGQILGASESNTSSVCSSSLLENKYLCRKKNWYC